MLPAIALAFWLVDRSKPELYRCLDSSAGPSSINTRRDLSFKKNLHEQIPYGMNSRSKYRRGRISGDLFFGFCWGWPFVLGGAYVLVECAVIVAKHFGLSDLIIGLTIIAIGTSLPELAASIMAVKKNEADIAIGNVIGSNMFNMLAVIGIPGMIHATDFDSVVLHRDFPRHDWHDPAHGVIWFLSAALENLIAQKVA